MIISRMTIMTLIKQGSNHLRLLLMYQRDVNKNLPPDKKLPILYHSDCDCFQVGPRKKEENGQKEPPPKQWG